MPKEPRASGRKPFPDDQWILEKVAQLRRLEKQSDPSNPDRQLLHQSEVAGSVPLMKDQDATNALRIIRALVDATAGWALNHHVGRALNQVSPAPASVTKGRGVIDPKLLASERRASADHHEPKGASYQFGDDPLQDRRALAAVVSHLAPIVSEHLAIHTEAALYALIRGEAIAPLHPETTRAQGAKFTLSILRLWAVRHREYLIGRDDPKAVVKVTYAYYVEVGTIEDWANKLESELPGFINIRADMAAAHHTGEVVQALSVKYGRTESEQRALDEYSHGWDDDALEARGRQYQRLTRKKPKKRAKPKK